MSKYAFRVKVYVEADTLESHASLGLVDNVFSWVAGGNIAVADTSEGKHGILARDFVDSIKKSVNIKRYGDIANIDGCNLKLDNTEKFWTELINIYGVNFSLHGSKVTIEEVTYNGVSYDSTLIYTGFCDLPSFDKSTYTLPIRGNGDVRRSKLGVLITKDSEGTESDLIKIDEESISKIKPLTFGKLENAQFIAYIDGETRLDSGDQATPEGLTNYPIWKNQTGPIFQDVSGGTALVVMGESYGGQGSDDDFIGQLSSSLQLGTLYIKSVRGDGDSQLRKVVNVSFWNYTADPSGGDLINMVYQVVVENNFTTPFFGLDDTSTGSEVLTWVEFYDIRSTYSGDEWICETFLDENLEPTTENYPIRIYDKSFEDIGEFTLGGNPLRSNYIQLFPNQFDVDPNKIVTFKISQDAPIVENTDPRYLPSGFTYDGLNHIWHNTTLDVFSSVFTEGNTQTDDNSSPYQQNLALNLVGGLDETFIHSMLLDIPQDVPSTFTNAYLIMNLSQGLENLPNNNNYDFNLTLRVKKQSWKGESETLFEKVINNNLEKEDTLITFNNFPTSYTLVGLNGQITFWQDLELLRDEPTYKGVEDRGYIKIPMDFDSFADMGSNKHIVIEVEWTKFDAPISAETFMLSLVIGSAGFVFEQAKDVDKNIYSNVNGRLWDGAFDLDLDWWTSELVRDPVGMLGHVKLLQDYSNEGETAPLDGWGKNYSSSYIQYVNVDGDTDGSFAHQDLNNYRNVRIGHQTIKESVSDSKSMSKKLCNQFFLISWVNAQGEECVGQIASKSSVTPSDTFAQSDMLSIGNRTEMDSRDVFTEPFINFKKNYANDKYLLTAKITRTSEDGLTPTQKVEAVQGLDELSQGERLDLWEKARALYKYYGVINEAPKTLTNHDYIVNQQDAYFYLDQWLTFQGVSMVNGEAVVTPRNFFTFTAPYERSRLLDVGSRIYVNVPNITDGIDYEGLIYGISKDVSKEFPEVKINVVLYDLAVADAPSWQDTFDDTIDPITQDTTDDLEDTIQDEI